MPTITADVPPRIIFNRSYSIPELATLYLSKANRGININRSTKKPTIKSSLPHGQLNNLDVTPNANITAPIKPSKYTSFFIIICFGFLKNTDFKINPISLYKISRTQLVSINQNRKHILKQVQDDELKSTPKSLNGLFHHGDRGRSPTAATSRFLYG